MPESARGAGGQSRLPRFVLLLLCCLLARAESMDDAVASLAKKVTARLGATETARVTARNASSLPAAEVVKVQAALNRALQRRVRNPMPVDVALTISENLRGYLLVAEIKREGETTVEMAEFRTAVAVPPRAAMAFERRLVWEQAAPILDLAEMGDQMLVLDTEQLSRYEKRSGEWEPTATAPVPMSNSRDPRGRVEVNGAVEVHVSGNYCRPQVSRAEIQMMCMQFDVEPARREVRSAAQVGADMLVAEIDGRAHLYDSTQAAQGVFEEWGSDFAAMAACGGTHIAATAAGDLQSPDSITLYDIVNRLPVRVSEPLVFPGPVTALWPSGDGALAVSRNLSTGRYAAYHLTLDCGR